MTPRFFHALLKIHQEVVTTGGKDTTQTGKKNEPKLTTIDKIKGW